MKWPFWRRKARPAETSAAGATTATALLVRSETYEPRWRATVDGKEARIFPADYAFQGVVVPPGRHRVAFRYVDRLMMLGMCISLAALAACVRALASRR